MSATTPVEPALKGAPTVSVVTLRRLADYKLPAEFDRRILDLGERKETLTPDERAELLAWVAFTQERSAEKLGRKSRCAGWCPHVPSSRPERERVF
jgi:hypothetical protein